MIESDASVVISIADLSDEQLGERVRSLIARRVALCKEIDATQDQIATLRAAEIDLVSDRWRLGEEINAVIWGDRHDG